MFEFVDDLADDRLGRLVAPGLRARVRSLRASKPDGSKGKSLVRDFIGDFISRGPSELSFAPSLQARRLLPSSVEKGNYRSQVQGAGEENGKSTLTKKDTYTMNVVFFKFEEEGGRKTD